MHSLMHYEGASVYDDGISVKNSVCGNEIIEYEIGMFQKTMVF